MWHINFINTTKGQLIMKIWAKPYTKKNGEVMIYLNNDRGVSYGIGQEFPLAKNTTEGMKNLYTTFKEQFEDNAIEFTGDLAASINRTLKIETAAGFFFITDAANVGGMQLHEDGLYFVKNNKILKVS
jgi:hypothetical protein